jgi:hypothetical protein
VHLQLKAIAMINLHNVRREYQGQNVVTPWDRLKRFMFDSYPVIKTQIKINHENHIKIRFNFIFIYFNENS